MAIAAKSLADGQVASSKGTIYTCPASTKTYVKWMSFHNTNAATQTLIVYVKRSGSSSRVIFYGTLVQFDTAYVVEDSLTLSAADVIEAATTTATAVDYLITGAEEA